MNSSKITGTSKFLIYYIICCLVILERLKLFGFTRFRSWLTFEFELDLGINPIGYSMPSKIMVYRWTLYLNLSFISICIYIYHVRIKFNSDWYLFFSIKIILISTILKVFMRECHSNIMNAHTSMGEKNWLTLKY